MQAIILAGGFGTRLKSEIGDTIKPMALIGDKPFLAWLLEYIAGQGVNEVLLCLHHKAEQITSYFGNRHGNVTLRYIIEDAPLGTGGALMSAMRELQPKKPVFALNGDSLVMLNYRRMMDAHIASCRPITIASARMKDCRRYSQLDIHNNLVTHYELYGDQKEGDISAGFYVLSPDVFGHDIILSSRGSDSDRGIFRSQGKLGMTSLVKPYNKGFAESSFSFERDFLAPNTTDLLPAVYRNVDYFIDIGVPEDYARGQQEITHVLIQAKSKQAA